MRRDRNLWWVSRSKEIQFASASKYGSHWHIAETGFNSRFCCCCIFADICLDYWEMWEFQFEFPSGSYRILMNPICCSLRHFFFFLLFFSSFSSSFFPISSLPAKFDSSFRPCSKRKFGENCVLVGEHRILYVSMCNIKQMKLVLQPLLTAKRNYRLPAPKSTPKTFYERWDEEAGKRMFHFISCDKRMKFSINLQYIRNRYFSIFLLNKTLQHSLIVERIRVGGCGRVKGESRMPSISLFICSMLCVFCCYL